MPHFEQHWNRNFAEAVPNKKYKVMTSGRAILTATYDPTWGNRRGAWFDTTGKLITDVVAWLDENQDSYDIPISA